MKLGKKCLSCLVGQIENCLEVMNIKEEKTLPILQDAMTVISKSDTSKSPPLIGREAYTRICELTGIVDPFERIKKYSNDMAMRLLPFARSLTQKGDDPILSSLKISITGNIIDYGAPGESNEDEIKQLLIESVETHIDNITFNDFLHDIDNSEKILFLGDNSGEIVFDKLFIENLPSDKIIFSVRGKPIINDSTLIDAEYTGLNKLVKVIDTGDNTPGIDFSRCSNHFLDEFKTADMIILKGQGNLETLIDENISGYIKKETPLYFLLKVKCYFVAELLEKNIGDIVFIKKGGINP
ncbi:DUF89 domain-containing protein [Spirochaetota bacterium]